MPLRRKEVRKVLVWSAALLAGGCSGSPAPPTARAELTPTVDAPTKPEAAAESTPDLAAGGLEGLWEAYDTIFPSGNRNAASHRWASYVLDRAEELEGEELDTLLQGFCPVSGSPVRPRPRNRYPVTLPHSDGEGDASGYVHFCCWPCICDTIDFIAVDTKMVATRDGERALDMLVIGDPCEKPGALDRPFDEVLRGEQTTLRKVAPELVCKDGVLQGATRSDHGHVVVGRLFASREILGLSEQDQPEALPSETVSWRERCEERASGGFKSGMGRIFREVAKINPL